MIKDTNKILMVYDYDIATLVQINESFIKIRNLNSWIRTA